MRGWAKMSLKKCLHDIAEMSQQTFVNRTTECALIEIKGYSPPGRPPQRGSYCWWWWRKQDVSACGRAGGTQSFCPDDQDVAEPGPACLLCWWPWSPKTGSKASQMVNEHTVLWGCMMWTKCTSWGSKRNNTLCLITLCFKTQTKWISLLLVIRLICSFIMWRAELGKKASRLSAPNVWNKLETTL